LFIRDIGAELRLGVLVLPWEQQSSGPATPAAAFISTGTIWRSVNCDPFMGTSSELISARFRFYRPRFSGGLF